LVHWNQTNHTHSYGADWVTNGTHHWHVCSCGDTSDYAEHIPGDWVILGDESKQRFCTVCNELVGIEAAPVYETGDVNGDGKINMFDYIAVKAHWFGTTALEGDKLVRADVNGDGKVNMFDYVTLKSKIVSGK
jgi:hypothetical protein